MSCDHVARTRAAFERTSVVDAGIDKYRLLAELSPGAYAARAPTGNPVLLVELHTATKALGRSTTGMSVVPSDEVLFETDARTWTRPAAIVECLSDELLSTFCVLVGDLVRRLEKRAGVVSWEHVVDVFDEWEQLLRRRRALGPDEELGLWAELWVIDRADRPADLVAAWRGPEGSHSDFFLDGVSVEVKASRSRLRHFISHAQLDRPAGEHPAFVLSVWAGIDPVRGCTLPELVRRIGERIDDEPTLFRGLLRAGFSPDAAEAYTRRFVVLERPCWFSVEDIPRVRAMDPGVRSLRYQVELDAERALVPDMSVLDRFGLSSTFVRNESS